jgi:hypothetical protein
MKELQEKFYKLDCFPEGIFRCWHLPSCPQVRREMCEQRLNNLKLYDDCKNCPIKKKQKRKIPKKRGVHN